MFNREAIVDVSDVRKTFSPLARLTSANYSSQVSWINLALFHTWNTTNYAIYSTTFENKLLGVVQNWLRFEVDPPGPILTLMAVSGSPLSQLLLRSSTRKMSLSKVWILLC